MAKAPSSQGREGAATSPGPRETEDVTSPQRGVTHLACHTSVAQHAPASHMCTPPAPPHDTHAPPAPHVAHARVLGRPARHARRLRGDSADPPGSSLLCTC